METINKPQAAAKAQQNQNLKEGTLKMTTIEKDNDPQTTARAQARAKYLDQIITAENLTTLATQIARRALATIWRKTLDPTIEVLLNGVHHASKNNGKNPLPEGVEIVQTAAAFLLEYREKKLSDPHPTEKLKTGEPCDIYRATLRAVNKYIIQNKNRVSKTLYLENPDTMEYIPVDRAVQIEYIHDYNTIKKMIARLKPSANELRVLALRFKGYSRSQIAKKLSITDGTLQKYCSRLEKKFLTKFTPYLQKIGKARGLNLLAKIVPTE